MEDRHGSLHRSLLLGGIALGAGLMYLLDPAHGRRRRALLHDKLVHAKRVGGERADAGARDLANRARGLAARVRSRLRRAPIDDRRLEERVRARIGRAVSVPGSIEVRAEGGVVELSGSVLAAECDRLLRAVADVDGVREVVDDLRPCEAAGVAAEPLGAPAH